MAATVWRGRIAFGLVSIPVRLYKAARRERVRFHNVYAPAAAEERETSPPVADEEPEISRARQFPAPALPARTAARIESPPIQDFENPAPRTVERVRHAQVAQDSQSPLAENSILKGYEIEPDRYVVLSRSEVAALKPRTSTELEVSEFIKLSEIDPVFFDVSYRVAPDRGGKKPYALLYRALAETGYIGLGSLAMHGREHAVVIRPAEHGLMLHTLFYANEVGGEDAPAADLSLVSEKELAMAKMLVEAQRAPFDASKLKDPYEERIERLIQSKSHRTAAAAREDRPSRSAEVVDIMEALRRSLAAVRKPAQSEKAATSNPANRKKRSK